MTTISLPSSPSYLALKGLVDGAARITAATEFVKGTAQTPKTGLMIDVRVSGDVHATMQGGGLLVFPAFIGLLILPFAVSKIETDTSADGMFYNIQNSFLPFTNCVELISGAAAVASGTAALAAVWERGRVGIGLDSGTVEPTLSPGPNLLPFAATQFVPSATDADARLFSLIRP